mmetsp:Transcript_5955/g.12261  ORF Transcript_5955/g.12261 Transcript_5955/m.12261 type:complete len:259 (+) Transcript_5955:508-1284(+)
MESSLRVLAVLERRLFRPLRDEGVGEDGWCLAEAELPRATALSCRALRARWSNSDREADAVAVVFRTSTDPLAVGGASGLAALRAAARLARFSANDSGRDALSILGTVQAAAAESLAESCWDFLSAVSSSSLDDDRGSGEAKLARIPLAAFEPDGEPNERRNFLLLPVVMGLGRSNPPVEPWLVSLSTDPLLSAVLSSLSPSFLGPKRPRTDWPRFFAHIPGLFGAPFIGDDGADLNPSSSSPFASFAFSSSPSSSSS